jgi:hypothetical protein
MRNQGKGSYFMDRVSNTGPSDYEAGFLTTAENKKLKRNVRLEISLKAVFLN